MANLKTRNKRLALIMSGCVAGMLGLAFASVPLYDLFCRATGYGGTPKVDTARENLKQGASDGQVIRVMFDANVSKNLDWSFKPDMVQVDVRPGVETLAIYRAKNTGAKPVVGTATFNVSPVKAAEYFAKVQCFCFTEQELQVGEEMPMPVSFYIDPEIFEDPNTQDVHDIVLSYTFYPAAEATAALQAKEQADGTHSGS